MNSDEYPYVSSVEVNRQKFTDDGVKIKNVQMEIYTEFQSDVYHLIRFTRRDGDIQMITHRKSYSNEVGVDRLKKQLESSGKAEAEAWEELYRLNLGDVSEWRGDRF